MPPIVGEHSAGSVEGERNGESKLVHKVISVYEREEVIIVIHINNQRQGTLQVAVEERTVSSSAM